MPLTISKTQKSTEILGVTLTVFIQNHHYSNSLDDNLSSSPRLLYHANNN